MEVDGWRLIIVKFKDWSELINNAYSIIIGKKSDLSKGGGANTKVFIPCFLIFSSKWEGVPNLTFLFLL